MLYFASNTDKQTWQQAAVR